MTITVELPDDLATHPNAAREVLEAFVIEGYRNESLSSAAAANVLGMGRLAFEGFLKERGVMDHAYDSPDLLHDVAVLDRLNIEGHLGR